VPEGALLLAFLGLMLLAVRHPGPLPGDVAVSRAVQAVLWGRGAVTDVIDGISTLNFPTPAIVTLAVVTLISLLLRRWLDAILLPLTAAAADGTEYLVNVFVHRPRPSDHGVHILQRLPHSYSFPSGHVTFAIAVWGLFMYLTFQIRRPVHPVLLWTVRAIIAGVIVLMPVSRVLEGEHWMSDVAGGALFGAFWLMLALHLHRWARRRWPFLLARDER
jgi:membrane-associated phospholipid phosphatase